MPPKTARRREPVWRPSCSRLVADLHDELARRRDDQRARPAGRLGARLPEQAREDRDEEGGRLARAGLRLAGDVAAGEREREGLLLDRRREDEPRLDDAPADLVGQVVRAKRACR